MQALFPVPAVLGKSELICCQLPFPVFYLSFGEKICKSEIASISGEQKFPIYCIIIKCIFRFEGRNNLNSIQTQPIERSVYNRLQYEARLKVEAVAGGVIYGMVNI